MKNFKRFVALAMAAAMVTGSAFNALAADNEGGATGNGDYEGYVEQTSVFSVEVPTDASSTAGFDFFVDPNNLLSQTGYASKGGQASEFDTNSTLFFTRTVSDTVTTKYGKDSDSITFTNKSSYDVDVEVSATVTGADGITLGAVSDTTTDPTISLSLVSGSETKAITADGAKLTGTIAGADDNFEIKWNSTDSKYEYGLIDSPDEDAWQTYSFNLTGACGGTWTAAQAEVEPTVNLTWKVTDPMAAPEEPTATPASLSSSATSVVVSGIDEITLKNVKFFKSDNTTAAMTSGTHYSFDASTGEFKVLKPALLESTYIGSKFVLTFSDDSTLEIPVVAAE